MKFFEIFLSVGQGGLVRGRIFFENQDISFRPIQERGIGLVMQDRYLFPHFTVRENLLFAMPKNLSNKNEFINKFLEEVYDNKKIWIRGWFIYIYRKKNK